MDEAKDLVSQTKATIPDLDLNKFDWEWTDRDQENFDFKMMTFLWFNEGVTPHDRNGVQLDIQKHWPRPLLKSREDFVRATFETALDETLEQSTVDFPVHNARERWPNEGKV